MKKPRVQPLGLSKRNRSQKRVRSITTDAARQRYLIVAAGLVVFVPTRGRFRVNITAPIVIRMAITGHMAGINIDLLFEARRIAAHIAKLPELLRLR
jgi:hypothetical protein